MENTCKNCVYFNVCGDVERTEPCKGKKVNISWDRMCELATKAMHKLLEDDYDSAMEFFEDEAELEDFEREFFGVPMEKEEYKFTCKDCPYHWTDIDGDIPYCHYDGEERYAPCSYEDDYEEKYDYE